MRKFNILSSFSLALLLASVQARADATAGVTGTEIKTGSKGEVSYEKIFPEIKQKELVKIVEKKSAVLVDANGTESYDNGHIPGAIDFDAAGEKFASMLPKQKDALIVAYCGGPGCQAWRKAADKLHAMGYTRVRHYKGGIKEWKTAGREMEKAQNPKG